METNQSVEKAFKMLSLLSRKYGTTRNEIEQECNLTRSNFYRYKNTLSNSGFTIESQEGYLKINLKETSNAIPVTSTLHFSKSEILLINKLLLQLQEASTHPILIERLARKLNLCASLPEVNYTISNAHHILNFNRLRQSITECRCVELENYHSSNSNQVTTRLVEPFKLEKDFEYIWAYDINHKKNKTFKISRIGRINILSKTWKYQKYHESEPLDILGISSYPPITISLKLTLKAKNLLIERYPLAENVLQKESSNSFILTDTFHGFRHIGRFVLSLPTEVEVIIPDSFKSYLYEQLKKVTF